MFKLSLITQDELQDQQKINLISHFLYNELGSFTDPIDQILSCIEYIKNPQFGGNIYKIEDDNLIIGICVVAKTKMEPFLPKYLLVYIAIASTHRGQGLGEKLITYVQNDLNDSIALHVEHDNPAKKLYSKLNFTNKYTEMRWYP